MPGTLAFKVLAAKLGGVFLNPSPAYVLKLHYPGQLFSINSIWVVDRSL